jgi:hypothetical protein
MASLAAKTPSICGMRLHQVLHHLQCLQALVVARLRCEQLDARRFLDGVVQARTRSMLVSAALDAFEHHQVALAAHGLDQVPARLQPELVVAGAHERDELAAVASVGDVHHRDLGGVDLGDGRHHGLVVHRGENDGVGLLDDHVLHSGSSAPGCCPAWSAHSA